jgi:hypothetical protein
MSDRLILYNRDCETVVKQSGKYQKSYRSTQHKETNSMIVGRLLLHQCAKEYEKPYSVLI